MGINGNEFANAGHPPSGNNKRQSQIGDLLGMGEQAFFDEGQACNIDIVRATTQRRLRDSILQQHHRPGAINNDRTPSAEVIERAGIQNVKVRC